MPDALHWSQLKLIGRSPAHYKHALSRPFVATAAMRLGTAVHHLLLDGPHKPVIFDGASRRTKEWAAFSSAQPVGATILLASEMDEARAIADAVLADPVAAPRLEGARELDLAWTAAGRQCAGRLDILGTDLFDLKTTADASPERFPWQVRRMDYAAQLAWYYDGAIAAGLPEPRLCGLIAVETSPPYPVVVYELTAEMLDMGRRRSRALLERLLVCEASDEWPGYAQAPIALDVTESEQDGPDLDFGDEAEAAQ